MSEVIYRKYRPKNFDEVVGLSYVKDVLDEQVSNNKISHAYLFSGPRGTGKTTIARLFARSINGISDENKQDDLDIIEIDAASNRGIDEIRELKKKINFVPVNGKFKVYIIDEVHMLTKEAFNALLKTLEEPPKHIVFVLATTEAHKIPMTILSRVMRFDFSLASVDELKMKFERILKAEKIKFDDKALDVLIKQAKGSFRDGESILQKIISGLGKTKIVNIELVEKLLGLADFELVENFLKSILADDLASAIKVVTEVDSQGIGLRQFIHQLLESSREIMIDIINKKESEWTLRKIAMTIKELSDASDNMRTALVSTLPLEIAIINLTLSTASPMAPSVQRVVEQKPVAQKIQSSGMKKAIKKINNKKNDSKNNKDDVKIVKKEVGGIEEKVDESTEGKALSTDFSLEDVINKWDELLNELKQHNHHLTAFLIKSKPRSLEGGILLIDVPFSFHKKKLDDGKSKKIIKLVMEQVYGGVMDYKCMVDDGLSVDAKKGLAEEKKQNTNKQIVEEIFQL